MSYRGIWARPAEPRPVPRDIPTVKVNPALTFLPASSENRRLPAALPGRAAAVRHSCNRSTGRACEQAGNRGHDTVFRLIAARGLVTGGRRPKDGGQTVRRGKKWPLRGLLVGAVWRGSCSAGCMQADARAGVGSESDAARQEIAGGGALREGGDPGPYQRHIVDYHRKEEPGTIVIDSDARYLYYVLPRRPGDPLRRHRRRGSDGLVGRRQGRPHDRMAVMDADRRRERAHGRAGLRRPGPAEPDGRARDVSVRRQQGHALPHPRHQPAGIYRAGDFLGLHPHDQRGRHRPLQAREDGHRRGRAGAGPGRLAVQSAAGRRARLSRAA